MRTNFKTKPWRSEKYRRFVASQPCCVCGGIDVQCHHEQEEGQGGMATKAGDERGTPLCVRHHDERTRGNREVWQLWGVDPEEVIAWMQRLWIGKGNKAGWSHGNEIHLGGERHATYECRSSAECPF